MIAGSSALLLSDEDGARVEEVQQLVARGPLGVAPLIARLDDPSWAVRREVVFALAQIGEAAVAPMCEALVSQRDLEARVSALVDALSASRGNPDPALMALTTSKDAAVICDAAQILGRRQTATALTVLSVLVEHVDDNVSVAAIEALGRIGGQQSVERLLRVLESDNFFRVFPAIDVVGLMGDFSATAPLVKLTGKALYTLEATRALGRIGDIRAIPALAALLVSPGDELVRTAATALWEIHLKRYEGMPNAATQPPSRWMSGQPESSARRLIAACNGARPAEHVAMCHVLGWLGTPEAIVALLGFLELTGDIPDAARASLSRLGDLIDAELLATLRAGDSPCRALLLPLVGRSPARQEVELCLRDVDPVVIAAACAALARLGDPAAAPALFGLLGAGGTQVSYAAVNAILSLGSNETERLALAAARSTNSEERRGALRIIATLGYESGLPLLLAAIEDPDERLRDIALPGLALLETPAALEALLGAATNASAHTRSRAVRSLAHASADPRVEQVLRAALVDADPWVRYHACQAAGRRKDGGALDFLVRRLEDEAGHVRIAAVEALAHLPGEIAMRALQVAAESKDADMRRAALVGLGLRGAPEGLPTLLEAARASEPATRLVALSALAAFKQPDAFDALVQAASDADDGVRSAAIALLSPIPGPVATLALVALIAGRTTRSHALLALARPAKGRVHALLDALAAADSSLAGPLAATLSRMPEAGEGLVRALGSQNVATRRAVASVLGVLSTSKARAALADAAARDPDLEVRRLAAGTLS